MNDFLLVGHKVFTGSDTCVLQSNCAVLPSIDCASVAFLNSAT